MCKKHVGKEDKNIMKKILTLLLALTMLMGTPVLASAAAFADTEGLPCDRAVSVLSALGIVQGKAEGAYEPASTLTRAEMATIILRAQNMEATATGRDIFTDVPKTHWAYANIAAAYQLGIVNGTSATTFEPDAGVTYEQAVKMMVAALGYSVKAEAQGGYPTGYLSVAAQLDLLKGVGMDKDMNRGNMAILLYNALEVDLFEKTSYGDGEVEYGTENKNTILSYYLKVGRKNGEITATPQGAIVAPESTLKKDEIVMGGEVFKTGTTNAAALLGARADLYYKVDPVTEEKVLLAAIPAKNTSIVEIPIASIDKVDSKEVAYTDAEGKDQEISISGATLLVNGTQKSISVLGTLVNGAARFVTNSGNTANYIICETYTNYVVEKADNKNNKVYVKKGSPLVLDIDLGDESKPISLTDADGKELRLSNLREWDIISVVKNESGDIFRVIRSNKVIDGKVIEEGDDKVKIGENEYTVAPGELAFGTIALGTEATFLFDFVGQIAAVDTSRSRDGKYAWLVAALPGKGMSGTAQIKAFTEDGEMKVFKAAETVLVNGTQKTNETLLAPGALLGTAIWASEVEPAPLVDAAGVVIPQLIKYKTDADDCIREIETATNKTKPTLSDADRYNGDEFRMNWYYHRAAHSADKSAGEGRTTWFNGTKQGDIDSWWNTAVNGAYPTQNATDYTVNYNGVFFGDFTLNPDAPLFHIPFDPTRDEEYALMSVDEFTNANKSLFKADARCVSYYDVDDDYVCNAVVRHTYLDQAGAGSDKYLSSSDKVYAGVVKSMSTILNAEGETEMAMTLLTKNGEVTATYEEDDRALYAQTASNILTDTKWYTAAGLNEPREEVADRASYLTRFNGGVGYKKMYLDIKDLVPGDIVRYELDDLTGAFTRVIVINRVNHMTNCGARTEGLDYGPSEVSQMNLFPISTGLVTIIGTVDKNLGDRFRVTTQMMKKDGSGSKGEATYTFINEGPMYRMNTKRQEIEEISIRDLQQGDEIFMYVVTDTQEMTIVYDR